MLLYKYTDTSQMIAMKQFFYCTERTLAQYLYFKCVYASCKNKRRFESVLFVGPAIFIDWVVYAFLRFNKLVNCQRVN